MDTDVSNANTATDNSIDFDSMSAEDFNNFDIDAFLEQHQEDDNQSLDNQEDDNESLNNQEDDVITHNPNQDENLDGHDDSNIGQQGNNDYSQDIDDDSQDDDSNSDTGSQLNELLKTPLKANGHEVIVDTPEKAIQLMQMGINYNKRLQEIKPYTGLVKALKDNNLADDRDIMNQLIDIAKGDKQALLDFAKRKNIDLNDDIDEDTKYKPNENISSDEEVAFDDVVSRLKSNDNYDKFSQNISNDFGDSSSSVFYKRPEMLEALSSDMDNGIYDKVMASVQSKKIFEKDNRPVIDIYIDSYSDVVKQINNKKQNTKTTDSNVNASKVSSTPSRQRPKQQKQKVNLAEVDLFSMSLEEADKFYNEHLKDLPL